MSQIGMGALDGTLSGGHTIDELLPIALLSHITFWTDLSKIPAADRERARFWLDWYRDHRATLAGPAYELTAGDPLDGKTWAAFQPWHEGRGALFAFRQGSADATQTFALRGLDPDAKYDVTDVATGHRVTKATGEELAAGLDVTLPENGAAVLEIDPVSG
jgi:hypothetical protein